MKKNSAGIMVLLVLLAVNGGIRLLDAHCQVPCGIYDDQARFKLLFEHITTLEKAMNEIIVLSKQSPVNYNQVVRWVMNKEKHAEEFNEILSFYFLAQRLVPKPPEEQQARATYLEQLELVHRLIVHAMKAKQGLDLAQIGMMNELLGRFQKAYFEKK